MVTLWGYLFKTKNKKQQIFKISINQKFLHFEKIEINIAKIINQAIKCIIL